MPVRSVIAGTAFLLMMAASFGAGWQTQGWRMTAQLEAKQAAWDAEKAAALLTERLY
ncbi:hypothetical protein [Thioclava sp. GXIMD4216]|uniref:hypothetical protein n=1 Tax=Thioclava sp. GXIMD4216 TaxID=3131929 RepID=UPI0030CDC678